MRYLLLILTCVLSIYTLNSCYNEGALASGDSNLAYRSAENLDIMTNFSSVVNVSSLFVENAEPYGDILGDIMSNAIKTTINGKGVSISNLDVNNIRLNDIVLRSSWHIDTLKKYLVDAELVLERFVSNGNYEKVVLGKLNRVNTVDNVVGFTLNFDDITSFMQKQPDRLFFTFKFNGKPKSEIEVTYDIFFSYNYSYNEKEIK